MSKTYPICPKCGQSYYTEHYSTTTCIGWTPIYKNGVLMNENPNVTTTHCTCCNCGTDFTYSSKYDIVSPMQASLDCVVSGPYADITALSIL